MTILVTGGAGFIGSNFIFYMLEKYPTYKIVCLDCLTYAGNISTLSPIMTRTNFRFVKGSVTDRKAVYNLFEEENLSLILRQKVMWIVLLRIRKFFWTQILKALQCSWMLVVNLVLNGIIKYLRMKYMAIFL